MKSRPCGSMFGSVLPSLKPLVSRRVNRSFSGFEPLAIALNSGAYLLFGLYARTIDVPAYWTYHLVNLGSSGVMLSPPTASNTFGVISPDAIFDSSSPDEAPRPEYVSPLAFSKAGLATLPLRNWSEDAYATLTVFDAAELEPVPEDEELPQPAAASPMQGKANSAATRAPRVFMRATIQQTIASIGCAVQETWTRSHWQQWRRSGPEEPTFRWRSGSLACMRRASALPG